VAEAAEDPIQPLSRRDRLRAATKDEIVQTARRLLVRDGPEAVSLRAIAREMGMTAPGLYRYFTSREELVRHLCADIFTELRDDIDEAIGRAAGGHGSTPDCDWTPGQRRAVSTLKMAAACSEFRRWALNHTSEFALIFGAPLPGLDDGRYDIADECALQFAGTFFALYLELWEDVRFPVLEPDEIDPGLRDQLLKYRDGLGADLPAGAMLTFLRCWVLLYGAVSMDVFGHIGFALEDASPMFEITLTDMATLLGLDYPVPSSDLPPASR
jgi:AcrR family transcriptional regulator